MVLKLQKKVESSIFFFFLSPLGVFYLSHQSARDPGRPGQVKSSCRLWSCCLMWHSPVDLCSSLEAPGVTSPSSHHDSHTLLYRSWGGGSDGGEEKRECSYIMANALCPCAVSAGRWCIAQHSRANGQMKQGRAGDGKCVEKHGMRPLVTSTRRSG